jgi:hypothetical protein
MTTTTTTTTTTTDMDEALYCPSCDIYVNHHEGECKDCGSLVFADQYDAREYYADLAADASQHMERDEWEV